MKEAREDGSAVVSESWEEEVDASLRIRKLSEFLHNLEI